MADKEQNIAVSENTPLEDVLEVPSLVQAALSKAGVYTVGDLAKWSGGRVPDLRGCGEKEIANIQELADAAEKLLDGDVSVPVEGLTAVPLPYVPTMLSEVFKKGKINTVEDLMRIDPEGYRGSIGWGDLKISLTVGLQKLYKKFFFDGEKTDFELRLIDVIPRELIEYTFNSRPSCSVRDFVWGESRLAWKPESLRVGLQEVSALLRHFGDSNVLSFSDPKIVDKDDEEQGIRVSGSTSVSLVFPNEGDILRIGSLLDIHTLDDLVNCETLRVRSLGGVGEVKQDKFLSLQVDAVKMLIDNLEIEVPSLIREILISQKIYSIDQIADLDQHQITEMKGVGEKKAEELRVLKVKALIFREQRRGGALSQNHTLFECPPQFAEYHWDEIPLRINAIARNLLAAQQIQTIAECFPLLKKLEDKQGDSADVTENTPLSINELNLSVRTRKGMVRLGVKTVNELLERSDEDLLRLKNFGVTSLEEVKDALKMRGLHLSDASRKFTGDFGQHARTTFEIKQQLFQLIEGGLVAYRMLGLSFTFLSQSDLEDLLGPDSEIGSLRWSEIPLKFDKYEARIKEYFEQNKILTVNEIVQLIVFGRVLRPNGNSFVPSKENMLGQKILDRVKRPIKLLVSNGLDDYRYGADGRPDTVRGLVALVKAEFSDRELEVVKLRITGLTLEQTAEQFGITRERVRQIEKKAFGKCDKYKAEAVTLLAPITKALSSKLAINVQCAQELIAWDESWHFELARKIAGEPFFIGDDGRISNVQLSASTLKSIESLVVGSLKNGNKFVDKTIPFKELILNRGGQAKGINKHIKHLIEGKESNSVTFQDLRELGCFEGFGRGSLRAFMRSQIVDGQVNGVFIEELVGSELFDAPEEILFFLGEQNTVLTPDGRLRRKNAVYNDRVNDLVEILAAADRPLTSPEIMDRSRFKWHQAPLVGNYLSVLFESVLVDRGQYVHAKKLGLSARDVKMISDWGAELLRGEHKVVEGELLFDLYCDSALDFPVQTFYQLASIVAKHPDVRRLGKTQLAHKETFDYTELYLPVTDPDIAAEWHPTKNGDESVGNVRPASEKIYWWQCQKGHEFQASPVFRTRSSGRICPGCSERWSVRKIRFFVKSLLEHIDAFTPAELYLIFQQSGILKTEGKSKDFIRDVNRGKISQTDLEKFVRGDQSTADDYLGGNDETDESNELAVGEDEEIGDTKPDDGSTDASLADEEDEGKIDKLPEVTAKAALKALDSDLLASLDTEAAEFLVASGKAKIWTHAYRDPATASAQAGEFGESEYAEQVREEFFREFEDATKLEIPDGYAFSVEGNRCEPNLMQRHVASQIAQCRRYGNWSGTGAGKTLSAILATRCVDASLTVICCPNAVVGNEKSGWMSEIKNVFPDSEVITKTFNPKWTGLSDHRYLVLNYEKFQQGDSEAKLKKFVDKHDVDFIVVDEIHYAKQRKSDDMSRRKRLVEAFISSVGESNPELCVLGMSATPVINNLQEGKSLVELVTSVEHHDLDVRSTVPNCMRLHQKLTTIGTRWKPNYAAKLEQKMIDVDCSSYLEEITELKKRNSPLALEKILTKARIPAILEQLEHGAPTLIYTYYVKDIDQMLKNAIVDAGYRVGFYTGESKEGLEKFKRGDLDVLIGSSAVGTGVDGLQHCCSKLVINSLPWTNAEYEQLLGRIWRQGQKKESVKIVILTTFAMVNGERWSYCDTKLDRIRYKKSVADAAVDGVVPEGNLRSPAQAQKDVMAWLKRLEDGVMDTVTRRKIVVPLVGDADLTTKRLAKYGDFSRMNNRWNQTHSENLAVRLQENPEEWEQYHTLYREARKTWEFVPVDDMIAWCKERQGYMIADFGCGEALLAKAVSDRHKVFSFDHIAIDDSVIEGDMADTTLDTDSIDVAVFCLSLMGQNIVDYIREAHRALKIDGNLHIYEATSRFKNVEGFKSSLERLGFSLHLAEERDKFTYIHAIKTPDSPQDSVELTL